MLSLLERIKEVLTLPQKTGARLVGLWGDTCRYIRSACLIIGIVTAAMDVTFGSFATIYWFLLAILFFIIVVCTEVAKIGIFLENKK
jgi:hypothetical protein